MGDGKIDIWKAWISIAIMSVVSIMHAYSASNKPNVVKWVPTLTESDHRGFEERPSIIEWKGVEYRVMDFDETGGKGCVYHQPLIHSL